MVCRAQIAKYWFPNSDGCDRQESGLKREQAHEAAVHNGVATAVDRFVAHKVGRLPPRQMVCASNVKVSASRPKSALPAAWSGALGVLGGELR